MRILAIILGLSLSFHTFGEDLEGNTDPENFKEYKVDECSYRDSSNPNEDQWRSLNFRRCNDNSYSFVQPPSTGPSGWEGKCGQTAASNALAMICGKISHPKTYDDRYFYDWTPGVSPSTLRNGMNKVFSENASYCPTGKWKYYTAKNSSDYIRYLKASVVKAKRSAFPVLVLMRIPQSTELHWVTLVDHVERGGQCHFILNHWDDQYDVPCSHLAKWSKGVGTSYPFILKSYAWVEFDY